ncbi:MAG: HAD family hydrolase [Thomasclavelia sp.]|nr:HAD family hydrolase [Thomasclavelia sp.]
MSKYIFFDIDGTLINCKNNIYSIPKTTRESMDKLKEKGHHVFLATGRCKCFITPGVFDYPFSGYITCNGGAVEYNNKKISKDIISSEAIKATIDLSEQLDMDYYFENDNYIYIRDKKDPKHVAFANEWGMKDDTLIDEFNPDEIETYIGMIVVKHLEDIPIMEDKLSKYFDVQRHQSDYSFDLTLKGVSKGSAILTMTDKLNISIKDTIAFGDGRNDIEMIQTVGMGVAMGNAVSELKNETNYITKSVDEDGITQYLKKINLI